MLPEVVHDGLEGGAAEEVRCGVGFGVAADLDDALALGGEGGGEVAGDGGFSDAAFAVDGDFLHVEGLLCAWLVEFSGDCSFLLYVAGEENAIENAKR